MKIRLHIERLIVDGLPIEPRQGRQLQWVVEAELTRLLTQNNALAVLGTGGEVASLDAGAMHMVQSMDTTGLGQRIAVAVHGGLGGKP
jgi:hypothetical protein